MFVICCSSSVSLSAFQAELLRTLSAFSCFASSISFLFSPLSFPAFLASLRSSSHVISQSFIISSLLQLLRHSRSLPLIVSLSSSFLIYELWCSSSARAVCLQNPLFSEGRPRCKQQAAERPEMMIKRCLQNDRLGSATCSLDLKLISPFTLIFGAIAQNELSTKWLDGIHHFI